MFGHADRRDGVVRTVPDVPVVLDPDLDPVSQSLFGDALAGERGLLGGEGHSGDLGAVLACCVHGHGAPAAADVEEAVALLQGELAADQVELVALGVLQAAAVLPVGAGVDHGRAEDQFVEVIAHVVVVADGLLVAASGVEGAGAAADLLGGRGRWRPGPGQLQQAAGGGPHLGVPDRVDGVLRVRPALPEQPGHTVQGLVQVAFDVEFARHPGAGQAQFARLPEQPAQCAAVPDDEYGGTWRSGFTAVPGPDPDRYGFSQQLLGESGQPQRGVCHGVHLRDGVSQRARTCPNMP